MAEVVLLGLSASGFDNQNTEVEILEGNRVSQAESQNEGFFLFVTEPVEAPNAGLVADVQNLGVVQNVEPSLGPPIIDAARVELFPDTIGIAPLSTGPAQAIITPSLSGVIQPTLQPSPVTRLTPVLEIILG